MTIGIEGFSSQLRFRLMARKVVFCARCAVRKLDMYNIYIYTCISLDIYVMYTCENFALFSAINIANTKSQIKSAVEYIHMYGIAYVELRIWKLQN